MLTDFHVGETVFYQHIEPLAAVVVELSRRERPAQIRLKIANWLDEQWVDLDRVSRERHSGR